MLAGIGNTRSGSVSLQPRRIGRFTGRPKPFLPLSPTRRAGGGKRRLETRLRADKPYPGEWAKRSPAEPPREAAGGPGNAIKPHHEGAASNDKA